MKLALILAPVLALSFHGGRPNVFRNRGRGRGRWPRHAGAAGLARAQKHSAHGALHRPGAGQVQGFMARLGSRFH
jgi:hypothetical protein